MFKRVLIAVDGSPHSKAAVAVAAGIAATFGAMVKVTHVRSLGGRPADGYRDVQARDQAVGLVNEALSQLDAAGVLATGELRTVDAPGLTARALIRAALDFEADLIVVGSRGRSDLAGLLLGSVSHEVLTRAAVPVLVVRSGKGAPRFAGVRRLLLAVDSSEESKAAVPVAGELARAYGASVVVLHVNHPTMIPLEGTYFAPTEEEADAATGEAVEELAKLGVKATAKVTWDPAPVSTAIAEVATQAGADLIVMGSRGLGELGSLLLGSTAHAVIRLADRPVMVAHRPRTEVKEAAR